MADFSSVEDVLGPWLAAATGVRVVTETPAVLPSALVQLVRVGGADIDHGIDLATVSILCFGTDRATAQGLAETVRAHLRNVLPGTKFVGFVVNRVQTISGPSWLPYVDTNVRVFDAAYQLTLHRQ